MAIHNIFSDKSGNGVGNSVVSSSTAVYAITISGIMSGALVDILVDLSGGENWVVV